ncbi:MAG: hydrogenase expression/formation protein HypE, partial [Clostridia bacterium]|nr:hydrogenase expression/formation protein HypE [Clostridia bacterium]
GTVLNEFANVSNCDFEIAEEKIPVTPEVEGFCKILGLNPLHMGNEGKMIAVVAEKDAEKAVQIIRKSKYGENAAIIGTVTDGEGVTMLTRLGGRQTVTELYGEGLPRIC